MSIHARRQRTVRDPRRAIAAAARLGHPVCGFREVWTARLARSPFREERSRRAAEDAADAIAGLDGPHYASYSRVARAWSLTARSIGVGLDGADIEDEPERLSEPRSRSSRCSADAIDGAGPSAERHGIHPFRTTPSFARRLRHAAATCRTTDELPRICRRWRPRLR